MRIEDVQPGDFVAYAANTTGAAPGLLSGVVIRPPTAAEGAGFSGAISFSDIAYWVARGSVTDLVVINPEDVRVVTAAIGGPPPVLPSGMYGPALSLVKKHTGNEAAVITSLA